MKIKIKKEKKKHDTSMYEIYYFNDFNNLELGCIYYGTYDKALDVTIEHQHFGLSFFAVVKNDEFVYLSDIQLDSEFLWKEIFYYRHFEDFVLISNKKKDLKIRK